MSQLSSLDPVIYIFTDILRLVSTLRPTDFLVALSSLIRYLSGVCQLLVSASADQTESNELKTIEMERTVKGCGGIEGG